LVYHARYAGGSSHGPRDPSYTLAPFCGAEKALWATQFAFLRCDFWSYDCRQHQAVITYLLGPLMPRVSRKLWDDLPAEALASSERFPLQEPPWPLADSVDVPFLFKSTLALYLKPQMSIN